MSQTSESPSPPIKWLRKLRVRTRLLLLTALPALILSALLLSVNLRAWRNDHHQSFLARQIDFYDLSLDTMQAIEEEVGYNHFAINPGTPAVRATRARSDRLLKDFTGRMELAENMDPDIREAALNFPSHARQFLDQLRRNPQVPIFNDLQKRYLETAGNLNSIAGGLIHDAHYASAGVEVSRYVALRGARFYSEVITRMEIAAPDKLINDHLVRTWMHGLMHNVNILAMFRKDGDFLLDHERLLDVARKAERSGIRYNVTDHWLQQSREGSLMALKEFYHPSVEFMFPSAQEELMRRLDGAQARSTIIFWVSLSLLLFGLPLLFLLSLTVYKSISNPLNEIALRSKKLAAGDLQRARSEDLARDEIGEVSHSLNRLFSTLRNLNIQMTRLREAAGNG
ncbi:MAG: HAMP domain-containing protein, partial [Verrucomicrobiota bacterium]